MQEFTAAKNYKKLPKHFARPQQALNKASSKIDVTNSGHFKLKNLIFQKKKKRTKQKSAKNS